MEKECYECLSQMMLAFMGTDKLLTYNFFTNELHFSKSVVSSLKQGKDMHIHHYVHAIQLILSVNNLVISTPELMKYMRQVLAGDCDMVVGTIPHKRKGVQEPAGPAEPTEWTVVMGWTEDPV